MPCVSDGIEKWSTQWKCPLTFALRFLRDRIANDDAVEPRRCWVLEPKSQLQAIAVPVSMKHDIPHHIHRYDPVLRWAGPERMCDEMLNQQIGTLTQCCLMGDVNLAKRQLPGANLADTS